VFFLIEDAFRVGDYVEVGNIKGTVEDISLRSLKLRHQRGAVHTLPFGQIKSLTNHTRDWALIRLEFRVAPETDLALAKPLVKNISKEQMADPDLAPGFIEPLKSQGIRSVEDGAIMIGIKYIAKPGTQFTIRREAYQRLIAAFREHGIELVGRGAKAVCSLASTRMRTSSLDNANTPSTTPRIGSSARSMRSRTWRLSVAPTSKATARRCRWAKGASRNA
jgi:moderate conductance mechanosensitive channel